MELITRTFAGDDEVISVDLSKMSASAQTIFFTVCTYTDGASLSQVQNAYCRLVSSGDGHELCRFSLSNDSSLTESAVVMCALERHDGHWSLLTLGQGLKGRTVRELRPSLVALLQQRGGRMVAASSRGSSSVTDAPSLLRETGRRIASMQEELRAAGAALEAERQAAVEAQGRIVELDEGRVVLTEELSKSTSKAEKLEREIAAAREELVAAEAKLGEETASHSQQDAAQRAQLEKQERDIAELEEQRVIATEKLSKTESKAEKLEEELAASRGELAASAESLQGSQGRTASLEAELAALQATLGEETTSHAQLAAATRERLAELEKQLLGLVASAREVAGLAGVAPSASGPRSRSQTFLLVQDELYIVDSEIQTAFMGLG